MLQVPGDMVQVRKRLQRLQHVPARIADLYLQRVKRGGRAGLGRIDVQPEAQRGRSCVRRDGDLLHDGVGSCRAETKHPCIERAGVRRLQARTFDDLLRRMGRSQYPRRRIGLAIFKARIAQQLCRCPA